ncbi:MAG: helix-turn-helix domain-containing protein, partial [Candidatus Puniceispirillum sp.]
FGSAPNLVLSRDDLAAASNGRMEGRSIDVAVARLRRKIEPDPRHPVYLQTVRNRGWMLRTDDPTQGQ